MKLTYYLDLVPNFGDELNAFMWDQLLPAGFLNEDEKDLFVGIGSIIWDTYPAKSIKHVMGSGYGGYTGLPNVKDGTWEIEWVRGPLSAEKLGLDPKYAITDSAILLRAIDLPAPTAVSKPAFMPHFQSINRGNWARVCEIADITFLDPRADPHDLIAKIRGASVLITEAMHGAIVADALRTPFIAVTPTHQSHRYKWEDWGRSVGLSLRSVSPILSSPTDAYVRYTGLYGEGPKSKPLLKNPLTVPLEKLMAHRAAARMHKLIKEMEPQLSSDVTISSLTDQSLDRLNKFVKKHGF